MKDLAKMRLGVLRQLKDVHIFIENIERSVKSRNPLAIQRAYTFLKALTYHMDEGDLTPNNIAYNLELSIALQELNDEFS